MPLITQDFALMSLFSYAENFDGFGHAAEILYAVEGYESR